MTSDAYRIVLDYAGCRLGVTSADAADIDWLIEFLTPSFAIDPADNADHELHFDIDAALHANLHAQMVAHPCTEVETFSFDGYLSQLPSWTAAGWRWLHDSKRDLFLGTDEHVRNVRLVAAAHSLRKRNSFMRVARELASTAQLQAGRLHIHAAAFDSGGGVLLCGPKHSGKTTLLIHALRSGARFISNDRVFVDAQASVRGMPTIVSLRPGTLDLHVELRQRLLASPYQSHLTLAEAVGGASPRTGPTPPHSLSARQLCQLVEAEMVGAAPLAMIVFPRVCGDMQGLHLRPLAPADALVRLRAGMMQNGVVPRLSEAFVPAGVNRLVDTARQDDAARDLVAKVPCFECLLGEGAYARAVLWQQRLAG